MPTKEFVVGSPLVQSRSPFATLRGTKISSVTIVSVNGNSLGAYFPTPSTWEYDVKLESGRNTFYITAEDVTGNISASITQEIVVDEPGTEYYGIFNELDEYGLLINLARLPGEKNYYYRNRLLHAEEKLGGTNYELLIRGASREGSFQETENVLTIEQTISVATGRPVSEDCICWAEASRFCLTCSGFRKTGEAVRIDPGSGETTLEYELWSPKDIRITDSTGSILREDEYEVLEDQQTIRVFAQITEAYIAYRYLIPFRYSAYPTLSVLATAISAAEDITGEYPFTATANYPTYRSANIIRQQKTSVTVQDPVLFDYSEIALFDVVDRPWRDEILEADPDRYHFTTKLQGLANRLSARSRVFVKDTVLDKDFVAAEGIHKEFAVLPNRTDSRVCYYRCQNPTHQKRYSSREYEAYSGRCPVHNLLLLEAGHRAEHLIAGVGYTLYVTGVDEEE